jgi:hypothetical protein
VGARTPDADLAGVQGLGQAGGIGVRYGHGFGWRRQPRIIGARRHASKPGWLRACSQGQDRKALKKRAKKIDKAFLGRQNF